MPDRVSIGSIQIPFSVMRVAVTLFSGPPDRGRTDARHISTHQLYHALEGQCGAIITLKRHVFG